MGGKTKKEILSLAVIIFMVLGSSSVASIKSTDNIKINAIVESSFEKTIYGEFVPGEVLVEFKDVIVLNEETVAFLIDDYGGISVEIKEKSNIAKVAVELDTELSYCENLKRDFRVKYVEPNYVTYVFKTPNDPKFNLQWGLQEIKCPECWDHTTGSSNVKIAIIDTGVDYNHLDLAADIWINEAEEENGEDSDGNGYEDDVRGWDFVDINIQKYLNMGYKKDPDEDYTSRDNEPMDVHSHGTHCAGIAGAVTDNSVGIAGVAWDCKIMPVRAGFSLIWEYEGTKYKVGALENEDIIDAIDYAADNGADVISMSFGGSGASSIVESRCNRAWNKGVVLVAATGNDYRGSASYPARYEKVIGVGAINEDGKRCDFSNYGAGLSLMAPGEDILSTIPGNRYKEYSGTSMACPHVAGVAALAISRFPNKSNQQIRDILENSADYIGPPLHYGKGLVDATFEEEAPPEEEEVTVTITMDYVEALDNIDVGSKKGEWFYEITVSDDYDHPTQTQTQVRYNKEYASWLPFGWYSTEKWDVENGIHEFTVYAGQAYVDISIRLYEWDGISLSDKADVSACNNKDEDWTWCIQDLEGREYAIRYHLDTNSVTTQANPCEDKIEDGDFYIANGEGDGSQGEEPWDKKRQDDAKIRYKIDDNYDPPQVSASIEGSPLTVAVGQELQFLGSVAGGAPPYSWKWRFRGPSDPTVHSTEQNATFAYTQSDADHSYNPSLEVIDALGVSDKGYVGLIDVVEPSIEITKPQLGYFYSRSTGSNGEYRAILAFFNYVLIFNQDLEVRAHAIGAETVTFIVEKRGNKIKQAEVSSETDFFSHTFDKLPLGIYTLKAEAYQGNTKIDSDSLSGVISI